MRRVIYSDLASAYREPVEVFWIAGLQHTERNEWWMRTVFRGRETETLNVRLLPIGMWPLLGLGIGFNRGRLMSEGEAGEIGGALIEDLAQFEVITSAEVPAELYPLPEGKVGTQRLLRYRTGESEVIIPVVELVRVLFVHNRALALALMRPAGLEQLHYPVAPAEQTRASLRFTAQMPSRSIGKQLAAEFAWIVLDRQARRSWDSVRRLSMGKPYVMFEPPGIRQSLWSFRGVRRGHQWFVLELHTLSGRRLPFDELEYAHPEFRRVMRTPVEGPTAGSGAVPSNPVRASVDHGAAIEASDAGGGSASYRNPLAIGIGTKRLAFENPVTLRKLAPVVEKRVSTATKPATAEPKLKKHRTKPIKVTTMERAGKSAFPPLDFRILALVPMAAMGDLEALDEAVRHLRDMLPSVGFQMSLVRLKGGRAISTIGDKPRPAMIVLIQAPSQLPIVVLDVERTEIEALSLMAMRFAADTSLDRVEAAAKQMLDGFVEAGGHWPAEIERGLRSLCTCERIPKLLIPRERIDQMAKYWAVRLAEKLGLASMLRT